ncbi:hypothetical protein V2A60_008089 [Cordyceps javanica]
MFSDASREAARKYGVSELRMLSNDLDSHIESVNDNTNEPHRLELKRSTARARSSNDDEGQESILAKFLSALAEPEQQIQESSDTSDRTEPTADRSASLERRLFGFGKGEGDAGKKEGPISAFMSNIANGAFEKLLKGTASGLAGAGFFGGVGVGEGAAQALNLTTAARSKSTGEQVAQANGMKSSGLNPIIQNAAVGLTATALKAVVDNQALQLPPIAALAASLGQGVGNGGAMGLGLTKRNLSPPLNGSGLVDGIGALGFGATQALTANLNLTGGLGALLPATGLELGRVALSAGSGIGTGAARGLKLSKEELGPPAPASNADLPGIAGTFAFGLSNALTDSLNVSGQSLAAMLPPIDLTSAALSVGDGIGAGAAQGLKLAQNDTSGGFGATSGPSAAPSMADLPKIAGALAFGASKSLTGSLNTSGASLSSILPADLDIGGVVLSAGRGLGGGASAGLGLAAAPNGISSRAVPNPLADVAGLVEKFTFGLGNSFTDKINLTSQASKFGAALPSVDLGATVLSAGSGLGLGLAKGLDLAPKDAVPPPAPKSLKDIPQLAGTFAFGLSDALSSKLNISQLTGDLTKNAGGLVAKFAAPVASGLGKGIGSGAAVGLGLQSGPPGATSQKKEATKDGEIDAEGLAQGFAEGLTSQFLANDTAGELIRRVSGSNGTAGGGGGGGAGSLLSGINVPRVANGLARGLLTGAGDGVQALGGIGAIINGTTSAPTAAVADTKIDFDDSAGGAAVGFGQGLGTSAVVTLQKLLSRGSSTSSSSSSSPPGPQRRDLAVFDRRQNSDAPPPPLNLSQFADPKVISAIAQKGIDVLTCDGVAGAFLILLGLQKSGTVSGGGDLGGNTIDTVKSLIPKGTIRVESQGNTFAIDGTKLADNLGKPGADLTATLAVNGSPVKTYAAFLVVHIASALIGLYVLWPLILILVSFQNMATRFRVPVRLPGWTAKTSKIVRLFVIAPFLVLILVFGIAAGAASGHFRTAHGILGFITLLFAIASLALSFFAKPAERTPGDPVSTAVKLDAPTWASHASNQVLLALLLPTAITGFADLSSVTLCLTRALVPFELAVSLGTSIVFVFAVGSFMSGLELSMIFMANRKASKKTSAAKEEAGEVSSRTQVEQMAPRLAMPIGLEKNKDQSQVSVQELRPAFI